MKTSITFLSIGVFAFSAITASLAAAQENGAKTVAERVREREEQRCIEGMNLTQEQLDSGFYKYQIDRCIQYHIRLEGSREYLERLAQRHVKVEQRFRRNTRFSSTADRRDYLRRYTEQLQAEDGAQAQQAASVRSLRRRLHQRSGAQYREEKQQRALQRRERAKQARLACQGVERSFYQNCVREMYRQLGSE